MEFASVKLGESSAYQSRLTVMLVNLRTDLSTGSSSFKLPCLYGEFFCKALFCIALTYLYAILYVIFNYGLIFALSYYAHYKVFYLSMCLNSYI